MWIESFVGRYALKVSAIASCIVAAALLTACGGGDNGAEQDAAAHVQAQSLLTYTRKDTYESVAQPDILVPMRDGFHLTCDLYRPGAIGVPAQGRFPGLLINFTAYGRKAARPGDLTDFAKKGYAVVWCNTRGAQGTGGSSPTGPESKAEVDMFSVQEAQDGYDVIEWIASQLYCDRCKSDRQHLRPSRWRADRSRLGGLQEGKSPRVSRSAITSLTGSNIHLQDQSPQQVLRFSARG